MGTELINVTDIFGENVFNDTVVSFLSRQLQESTLRLEKIWREKDSILENF